MSKIEFKSKDNNGDVVEFFIVKPSSTKKQEAKLYSMKMFTKCMSDPDIMTKSQLYDYMEDKHIFTKKDKEKVDKLIKERDSLVSRLTNGKKLKRKEARKICQDIQIKRNVILLFENKVSSYESNTVEGLTDNAYNDCLFWLCCLKEDGELFFDSIEEYKDRSEEEEYVSEALEKFVCLINGIKEDWYNDLPEAKFLRKYGMVNDKGQFINESGEVITVDGDVVEESKQEEVEENFVELAD